MSILILDDRDANVTRAGQWANAGVQQEYLQTTTSSGTQGSTLKVNFHGTEISVYGTLGFGSSSTMSFSIDSSTPSSFTAPVSTGNPAFHQKLFSSATLTDGPHVLTVTQQTSLNPTTATNLFIDYFLVHSGSAGDNLGLATFIDDTYPAISYQGTWSGGDGTDQDLQSSLHTASQQGDTATLTFDGTAVLVYGNIKQNTTGQIASFSVDKATPFTYDVPASPPFVLGVASNQQFFQATGLSPGNHTLVMTALTAGTFFLDYATTTGFVLPAADPGSSSSSGSSHSSTGSSTGSSTSSGSKPTGNSSSSTDSATTTHSSSAGAIAGGVVGGLVALAALVLFFVWYRRRQREDELDVYGANAFSANANGAAPGQPSRQPLMTQQPNAMASSSFTGASGQYGGGSYGGQYGAGAAAGGVGAAGYAGNQYAPNSNSNHSASVYTAGAAGIGAGQGDAGQHQPYYPPAPASNGSQGGVVSPAGSQLSNPYSNMWSPPVSNGPSAASYGAAAAAGAAGVAAGMYSAESVSRSASNSNRQLPPTPGSGPGSAGGGSQHAREPSGSTDYAQSASVPSTTTDAKSRLEWATPRPAVVQHQDSGLRNVPAPQPTPIIEVPPEYTAQ